MAGKIRRNEWGTVRLLPSGNWQAFYRYGGLAGVQESEVYKAPTTYRSRADALVWLAEERRLIETGAWTPPANRLVAQRKAEEQRKTAPTVASYGSAFVERPELSATSRDRYRQLLKFYILGEPIPSRRKNGRAKVVVKRGLGDVLIEELTRAQVRAWWDGLPIKTREPSCRLAYDLLRAIMRVAVDDELVTVSPVRIRGASKPSREREDVPLPDWALLAVANAMPERYRAGVLLAGVLGMRSGEVRALQRGDVQEADGRLWLRVERSVKEAEGKIFVDKTKTEKSRRTVPIPDAIAPDIRQHLRDHAQLGPSGLLFWSTDDGGLIRSAAWLKTFKRACRQVAETTDDETIRRALLDHGGYVFHGLRATGLSQEYRASEGNMKVVQALGGHTNPKTAMRYQRAESALLAEIADRRSDALREARQRQ